MTSHAKTFLKVCHALAVRTDWASVRTARAIRAKKICIRSNGKFVSMLDVKTSSSRFIIFTREKYLFWFTSVEVFVEFCAMFEFATNMLNSLAMLIHSFDFVLTTTHKQYL